MPLEYQPSTGIKEENSITCTFFHEYSAITQTNYTQSLHCNFPLEEFKSIYFKGPPLRDELT